MKEDYFFIYSNVKMPIVIRQKASDKRWPHGFNATKSKRNFNVKIMWGGEAIKLK